MKKIIYILIVLSFLMVLTGASASALPSVSFNIDQVRQECTAACGESAYDRAVWMFDWLNQQTTAEKNAATYKVLLDAVGIENLIVQSDAMHYTWNLVKLDGQWCHVDCTWAGAPYAYFGMNDALMLRDHIWDMSSVPQAPTLQNYYPMKRKLLCFSNADELSGILAQAATMKANPLALYYTGTDASQYVLPMVRSWVSLHNAEYGLRSFQAPQFTYSGSMFVNYCSPWIRQGLRIPAPSFNLSSPEGQFKLENYRGNGVMLIFGGEKYPLTADLLFKLNGELSLLRENGIEVLINAFDAEKPSDLAGLKNAYPGFHYTYENMEALAQYANAVGEGGKSIYPPCVFLINGEGYLTYYSLGAVNNVDVLIGEAFANSTDKPLPGPEKHVDLSGVQNGIGNIFSIANGGSLVTAIQNAATHSNVIFLLDIELLHDTKAMLDYYQENYRIFSKLNTTFVVSCLSVSEENKAKYPNCIFVEYSENDLWKLLDTQGWGKHSASVTTCMFISQGGNIIAFNNGGLLDCHACALLAARGIRYNVKLPGNLQTIEEEAFRFLPIQNIDLGNVRHISSRAFEGCGALCFVHLPETIETIAEDAFANCGSNVTFICTIGTPASEYAEAHGIDWLWE